MTIFGWIISIAEISLIIMMIYILFKIKQVSRFIGFKDNKKISIGNIITVFLLLLAICLFLFSFASPFLIEKWVGALGYTYKINNTLGDTIGGIMNPFVALSGVIVTGLAFYMQLVANKQQREFFYQDQNNRKFESQFYEMLRLQRENVTEMKISGYDFDEKENFRRSEKSTEGRKVFVTMKKEFECLLAILVQCEGQLNKQGFERCYEMFFWGIDEFKIRYSSDTAFIRECRKARSRHGNKDQNRENKKRKNFKGIKLNFNHKPFSGHSSRLGHYFRHLYMTVRSVAQSDVITEYSDRMKYLKILRGQLSNHEQAMLFYNWLSSFGGTWENNEHRFFTEYLMIHNLWFHHLSEEQFVTDAVDFLRNREVVLRPERKKTFEND